MLGRQRDQLAYKRGRDRQTNILEKGHGQPRVGAGMCFAFRTSAHTGLCRGMRPRAGEIESRSIIPALDHIFLHSPVFVLVRSAELVRFVAEAFRLVSEGAHPR